MPMPELLQRLGDAVAGVDREAIELEGMMQGADYNNTRAQTDAAMRLAEVRRLEAEQKQRIERSAARLQAMTPDTMMDQGFGDLVTGDFGSSAAAAYEGRLRHQEYGHRETIADPIAEEAARVAAAQAVSPNRLAGTGLGDLVLEVVEGPDGRPELVERTDAPGRVPMNRVNPAENRADADGDGSGSFGDDFFPSADMNTIRGLVADRYGGIYDPDTGRISGLDPEQSERALALAAAAAQIFASNPGLDHASAVARALAGETAPAGAGDEAEAGAGDEGDWQEGDRVQNEAGEVLVLKKNAQGELEWLPED